MKYDYVIVGAGPCGLTIAWLLSKEGKKCLVIDRESSIGGAHRVKRINNKFSEHGPRVYSSSYINTIKILNDMNIPFNEIFIPIEISFLSIGQMTLLKLSILEIIKLMVTFLVFLIYPFFAMNITVQNYMDYLNFSNETKYYFDGICRTTDGMGADKYTLYQFLEVLNQNILYKIYQPKESHDIALFSRMKKTLENTGNITFKLNTNIKHIKSENNLVSGVITDLSELITANNYILAIPPKNLFTIMPENAFLLNKEISEQISYNTYINIIFYWDHKLILPAKHGFAETDWGLLYIILSIILIVKIKDSN
jgi:uncharacterized protein with NAD-binding domain and iron-sulfur cluster